MTQELSAFAHFLVDVVRAFFFFVNFALFLDGLT